MNKHKEIFLRILIFLKIMCLFTKKLQALHKTRTIGKKYRQQNAPKGSTPTTASTISSYQRSIKMQKNWKDSEFFKKLKHIRVNRAVYLSAIIVLLSISVVLIITAVNNRANKKPVETTPAPIVTTTTTAKPQETTPPPQIENNDKPTQVETIPEFALPVSGVLSKKHSVDTQVFSPTLNEYRVHLGIDIATEEAAPVFAMAAGTVAQIWEDPMMGWSIALSHTGDAVTVYKNLSKQFADGITVGAEVEAGQLLGSVGDSAMIEIAEEPHLHMEMTVKGLQVDPLEYFSQEVLNAITEDSIYESEIDK